MILAVMVEGPTTGAADQFRGFKPHLIGISVPTHKKRQHGTSSNAEAATNSARALCTGTVMIVEERPGLAVEHLKLEGSFPIRRSNPDYDTASEKLQGITKIVFAVDNLEAALADLKRKEVHLVRELTELKSFNVKFASGPRASHKGPKIVR